MTETRTGNQPKKKETVYSGHSVGGTVYGGEPLKSNAGTGTGSGTTSGTIYGGAPAGTVYDETKHVPKTVDTTVARKAVTKKTQLASIRFFIIGAISLSEFFIYREDQPTIAFGSLALAVLFVVVGIFAFRLNRKAFLVAMGLYGLETLVLLMTGLNGGGISSIAKPLIVHAIILYRMYKSYELLGDLHELENG